MLADIRPYTCTCETILIFTKSASTAAACIYRFYSLNITGSDQWMSQLQKYCGFRDPYDRPLCFKWTWVKNCNLLEKFGWNAMMYVREIRFQAEVGEQVLISMTLKTRHFNLYGGAMIEETTSSIHFYLSWLLQCLILADNTSKNIHRDRFHCIID